MLNIKQKFLLCLILLNPPKNFEKKKEYILLKLSLVINYIS